MIIETLPTTFLQIFCKFILHFKVIFKSMTGPDDTSQVDLHASMNGFDLHRKLYLSFHAYYYLRKVSSRSIILSLKYLEYSNIIVAGNTFQGDLQEEREWCIPTPRIRETRTTLYTFPLSSLVTTLSVYQTSVPTTL